MKLKTLVLTALAFSFLFVGGVRAEEVEPVVVDTTEEEVSVPNPESFFFGLQVAWMRVTDNIEIWLAKTDDKKTDLEVKFAEKEIILMDRIVLASETNPELADALENQLDKLEDRHEQRLERIDTRIAGFESRGEVKGGDMEERMQEWQEKIQVKRAAMEQKRQEIQERVKIMQGEQSQNQLQDGSGDGQEAGPGDGDGAGTGGVGQMESQSVNLEGSVQKVGGR